MNARLDEIDNRLNGKEEKALRMGIIIRRLLVFLLSIIEREGRLENVNVRLDIVRTSSALARCLATRDGSRWPKITYSVFPVGCSSLDCL